jgi:hypothetical protein
MIGSWQDIKNREVADLIWILMIGGGILIHAIQVFFIIFSNNSPIDYIITWFMNFVFAITLTLFMSFSGLGGEADRIAFVAIAAISPVSLPFLIIPEPILTFLFTYIPRIFGVFCNSYLIAIPIPFLIFGFNLINQYINPNYYVFSDESTLMKIFVRFVGYPRSTDSVTKEFDEKIWHYDFLEDLNEENAWKIVFKFRLGSPEADLARKKELVSKIHSELKPSIWVQPTLPFIAFLMIGFFIEICFGNLILILIFFLI